MNIKLVTITIPLLAIILSGCETTNSIPYKASTNNIITIQQKVAKSDSKVRLDTVRFSEGINDAPLCRLLGPVRVAPGKTIQQYIEDAFREELFLAGIYSPSAPNQIQGTIMDLSFSSVSPAKWNISMTVNSTTSDEYTVAVEYPFNTSFSAYSACQNVADAFGPAVQQLLSEVVNNQRFIDLIGVK